MYEETLVKTIDVIMDLACGVIMHAQLLLGEYHSLMC